MPDSYVLDASVVLRWFLPDQDAGGHAQRLLALVLAGDIVAVAPRNLVHEFCGGITKEFRIKHKSVGEAIDAFRAFLRLPIRYSESDSLIEGAIRLSHSHGKTFYDTYYFSVGEHEGIRVCTADERSVAGVGLDFPPYVLLRNLV
jgi:predicted nucleic acid-binding protein